MSEPRREGIARALYEFSVKENAALDLDLAPAPPWDRCPSKDYWLRAADALRPTKPEPRRMYDSQNGDHYVIDAAGNAYEPAAKPERERVIEFALQPFIDGLSGTEAAKMIDKRYPGLSPIQIVVTKFQYQAAKDALKGTPA